MVIARSNSKLISICVTIANFGELEAQGGFLSLFFNGYRTQGFIST